MIDEYDNFANTMLADSENNYMELTHGDGFFRLFFNNLKAATTENNAAVSRIMISGVTPLTLSDVTSGYNIGENISTDNAFNTLAGFTESEFRQMLEYYRDATGIFKHTVDELIEITKPWYDNNCFSTKALNQDRMYNSDMALYFIKEYIKNEGEIPEKLVDANINQRLIENIFFKNSPLHDGAMIISQKRIKAAGCILPVSHDLNIPRELGLRHRAAMGISQASDAVAIVVSEETGRISAAIKGQFRLRLSAENLEAILTEEL